jgi:predicted nuclease of restriction endonuclease-like (RecB) superfamily
MPPVTNSMSHASNPTSTDYAEFLRSIKQRIQTGRAQAYRAVNRELIDLYWSIGQEIVERQERHGWGKSVVEQLSLDLRREIPDQRGFSAQNLWFMRQLFVEYRGRPVLLQLVREIPWGQNISIMTKVKAPTAREYYLRATAQLGWSRNVLSLQIEAQAYERQVLTPKQHNFKENLPEALAEQADLALKDTYALDFLGLHRTAKEREIEGQMIARIRDVLLELGVGFSFIGSQYKLVLGEDEYFIDLLFFHRPLRCLVAIDLKVGEFQPEHAGKLNFYLNILDDQVKQPDENPSIGIILCQSRNRLKVEYALRGITKPMGVAEYYLTRHLPPELAKNLPSADQLEHEIESELNSFEE